MYYFLITKYGAIKLTKWVTRVGRQHCDIHLSSLSCSSRHGSIIQRSDGLLTIINHSPDEFIYINEYRLDPGQSIALSHGDVISFSGDEFFKIVHSDVLPTILIVSSPRLSPD